MKDYEKPYFKEYLKLCNEIEMLPASEQETKVITMFHEFYKNTTDSVELSSGIAVRMIAKTASMQTSRDAWKKVAEELGSNIVLKFDYDCFGDPIALRCPICHKKSGMADRGADGDHKPNCPIEQMRKLKEGE